MKSSRKYIVKSNNHIFFSCSFTEIINMINELVEYFPVFYHGGNKFFVHESLYKFVIVLKYLDYFLEWTQKCYIVDLWFFLLIVWLPDRSLWNLCLQLIVTTLKRFRQIFLFNFWLSLSFSLFFLCQYFWCNNIHHLIRLIDINLFQIFLHFYEKIRKIQYVFRILFAWI